MIEIRDFYLRSFRTAFDEYREAKNGNAYAEIKMLVGKKKDVDEVFNEYVFDAVTKLPANNISCYEINVDPLQTSFGSLTIGCPVVWNGVEFRCRRQGFSIDKLAAWAKSWIDDCAPPCGPQSGFSGIIHSVTLPEAMDERYGFSVDFGSAPVDAFAGLVSLLGDGLLEVGSYALSG